MNVTVTQVDWVREQAEQVGPQISSWMRIVMSLVKSAVRLARDFAVGIVDDDGWASKIVTILRWIWTVVWEMIKLGSNYNAVFHMPVGDDIKAYEEAIELYKTTTTNYDYIPAITVVVLLIVTWDYLYDIVVGKLPGVLRHTVFTRSTYSFVAKIYPVLISLILLPYIIYIYTYIYSPGEFNSLSLTFPPSHHLFPVCVLINAISIFYLSFRYIRAGFDGAGWRVSLCLLAAVFGCISAWYESMRPPASAKYFYPYKVLYKYFYTRIFVYIYIFDLAVVVYAGVALVIFASKKYHQRFSNKKPPKDD